MLLRKSLLLFVILGAATNVVAQENRLTVDRLFNSSEFKPKSYSVNWMPEGGNYFVQQPAADGKGNDIVLINPKSEDVEPNILIAAKDLVLEGESDPIAIESFQVSPDENKVLVFNNSKRVWRYNTRGDFWIVDMVSGTVRKLGGKDAAESSLKFAKFLSLIHI